MCIWDSINNNEHKMKQVLIGVWCPGSSASVPKYKHLNKD